MVGTGCACRAGYRRSLPDSSEFIDIMKIYDVDDEPSPFEGKVSAIADG